MLINEGINTDSFDRQLTTFMTFPELMTRNGAVTQLEKYNSHYGTDYIIVHCKEVGMKPLTRSTGEFAVFLKSDNLTPEETPYEKAQRRKRERVQRLHEAKGLRSV